MTTQFAESASDDVVAGAERRRVGEIGIDGRDRAPRRRAPMTTAPRRPAPRRGRRPPPATSASRAGVMRPTGLSSLLRSSRMETLVWIPWTTPTPSSSSILHPLRHDHRRRRQQRAAQGRALRARAHAGTRLADHPGQPGARQQILGEPVYRTLADVPEQVGLVDVFRPSESTPDIARQAVAAGASALWLQLHIARQRAARIARTPDCSTSRTAA